jgi:hypothetical protein
MGRIGIVTIRPNQKRELKKENEGIPEDTLRCQHKDGTGRLNGASSEKVGDGKRPVNKAGENRVRVKNSPW